MNASCVSEFSVHIRIETRVQPRREAIVARDIGRPRRLLAGLEILSMRSTVSRRSVHSAEYRLIAEGQNVVPSGAHADELPNVNRRASAKMCVEAQRGVRSKKQPRIGSSVGKAGFQEGHYVGERAVNTVRPVEGRSPGAQAELAISQWSRPGHNRSEINRWMQILPPEIYGRISHSARRCASCRRTGPIHKINRHAQVHAEVLRERVANAGIEFVHLPQRVRSAAELHIRREAGIILRSGLSLRKSRCSQESSYNQNCKTGYKTIPHSCSRPLSCDVRTHFRREKLVTITATETTRHKTFQLSWVLENASSTPFGSGASNRGTISHLHLAGYGKRLESRKLLQEAQKKFPLRRGTSEAGEPWRDRVNFHAITWIRSVGIVCRNDFRMRSANLSQLRRSGTGAMVVWGIRHKYDRRAAGRFS